MSITLHKIPGLTAELTDRELAIYEGRAEGVSEETRQRYIRIWKREPASSGAATGPPAPLPVLPECRYLGDAIPGKTVGCRTCSGLQDMQLYECALHGQTVIGDRAPADNITKACRWCSDRPRPERAKLTLPPPVEHTTPTEFRWVSTPELAAAAIVLAGKLPPDVAAVAGIPRSGMIPASIIATHLHLPLYELTEAGKLNRLGHGSRGRTFGFPAGGKIAVIDDTCYGGSAMARARHALADRPAVFGVVYSRTPAGPDVYAELLPSPHLLEWNVMNNGPFTGFAANPVYRGGVGLDLDGIIVHDEESAGAPGEPYLVPRTRPCKLICTGRHERHRAHTEALLRRIGAKWERLAMLPDDQPQTVDAIATHKARHYADSNLGFFLESNPEQAALISSRAARPVVCPISRKVWSP